MSKFKQRKAKPPPVPGPGRVCVPIKLIQEFMHLLDVIETMRGANKWDTNSDLWSRLDELSDQRMECRGLLVAMESPNFEQHRWDNNQLVQQIDIEDSVKLAELRYTIEQSLGWRTKADQKSGNHIERIEQIGRFIDALGTAVGNELGDDRLLEEE